MIKLYAYWNEISW